MILQKPSIRLHQTAATGGPSNQLRIIVGSALNRPVDDWGKLLGDTPAVTAMLDRMLHHGHVLKCGPKSWRMKEHSGLRTEENQS